MRYAEYCILEIATRWIPKQTNGTVKSRQLSDSYYVLLSSMSIICCTCQLKPYRYNYHKSEQNYRKITTITEKYNKLPLLPIFCRV